MLDLVPRSLNKCCGFQWVLLYWVVIYFQFYLKTCQRVTPWQNLKIRVKRLFLKKKHNILKSEHYLCFAFSPVSLNSQSQEKNYAF